MSPIEANVATARFTTVEVRRPLSQQSNQATESERARKVGGIIPDMLREALYEDEQVSPTRR